MSYSVPCVVVQRTADRQQALMQSGFASKHDRFATASGQWTVAAERAASCAFLLVATGGLIVEVGRILDAEPVPDRWRALTDADAAAGFEASGTDRVVFALSPHVPAAIETLIGQPIRSHRRPYYVTVTVSGARASITTD